MARRKKEELVLNIPHIEAPVLGLDPSMRAFGVCASLGGTTVLTTIKEVGDGFEYLHRLEGRLADAARLGRGGVFRLAVVESYGYSPIASNLFQMGQVHGVVLRLLYKHDVPTLYVTPQHVKKFCTGRASAEKSDMKLAAYKKYGLEASDDNQVDAYVLAKMGETFANPDARLLEYEREVMGKVAEYTQKTNRWLVRHWELPEVGDGRLGVPLGVCLEHWLKKV